MNPVKEDEAIAGIKRTPGVCGGAENGDSLWGAGARDTAVKLLQRRRREGY